AIPLTGHPASSRIEWIAAVRGQRSLRGRGIPMTRWGDFVTADVQCTWRLNGSCRGLSGKMNPMNDANAKKLIVVGDRVLIAPEEGEERSKVGLYLPASAVDNQAVQGGKVIATGPGTPISAPTELNEEPWKIGTGEARFLPVQAQVGDYAIFF